MAKLQTIWLGSLALWSVVLATGVTVPAGAATIGPAAGTGDAGYRALDEKVLATSAWLNAPHGLAALPGGGWLIADTANDRIRAVDAAGMITTVAGGGDPASEKRLYQPTDVAVLPGGGFVIADSGSDRIVVVDAGTTRTLAGPDGLDGPTGVEVQPDGSVLVADTQHHRVQRVDVLGTITTIAGTGEPGFGGDGGAATSAQLWQPTDVALLPDGAIAIADRGNDRVRRISPTDGTMSTLAGGLGGFGGDGGPATAARLDAPSALALAADGALIVADESNRRVRRIAASGRITTIAGSGEQGSGGDGGPATAATLDTVRGIAAMADGSVLLADSAVHRVRRVVANLPPTVTLSGPDQVTLGQDAAFVAAPSGGGDDAVAEIAWDLDGDQQFETVTGLTPRAVVRSSAAGSRTVRVRAIDDYGAEAIAERSLQVVPVPSSGADEGGGEPFSAPPAAPASLAATAGRRVETIIASVFKSTQRWTRVVRLTARAVPAGARISVRCSARGCPRPWSRRYASARESVNLRRLAGLAGRRLGPGRLEIRVTAPGWIGKVVRWTMRRGRSPVTRTLCLPEGASNPRSCGASERTRRP